jgi:outer membrane protein
MIKSILIALAILLGLTSICLHYLDKEKIIYVDTGKLVSEFLLAKELNTKMDEIVKARKSITDSLYREMKKLTLDVKMEKGKDVEKLKKLATLEDEYNYKFQEFEKSNKQTSVEYMDRVWGQLNQYVNEFGKKNGCIYILGANGQGNIMFAKEDKNITTDLIQYVNERYEDKTK